MWVGCIAEFSQEEPIANSSMLALPVMTASEAISFSITVALYGGLKLPSILDAQVVSVPLVQMLSLMAIGIPASADSVSPLARFLSTVSACASADSSATVT